jgi:hypothetical protein
VRPSVRVGIVDGAALAASVATAADSRNFRREILMCGQSSINK